MESGKEQNKKLKQVEHPYGLVGSEIRDKNWWKANGIQQKTE